MVDNLKEERLTILKMVQEGKISTEEALEILSTLEEKTTESHTRNAKWLRVRVYEPNGKTKVNVNIPITLVDVGLKLATKFSPELNDTKFEEINFDEILEAIKSGAEGKIVDIETENGERVEVYVE